MPGILIEIESSECFGNDGALNCYYETTVIQDITFSLNGALGFIQNHTINNADPSGFFLFSGLPDDTYTLTAIGSVTGNANLSPSTAITCSNPPTTCDLVINSVIVDQATNGQNNGKVTVNASGSGIIEYSLNSINWQTSPVFTNRAIGVYTAYIRKQDQLSCGDEFNFQISAAPVLGCTNPDALNFNPAATSDNGTCEYLSQFYACGGVLPNPVFIGVNLPVTVGGVLKKNHYVKVNIYKTGETIPFATAQQTLRNGSAQVDISRYLKNQFTNTYQEPTAQIIYRDDQQSFGFYVGIIEHYNGLAQPEVLRMQPPKVAVNAALPEYADSVEPYLIKGTTVMFENPTTPGV